MMNMVHAFIYTAALVVASCFTSASNQAAGKNIAQSGAIYVSLHVQGSADMSVLELELGKRLKNATAGGVIFAGGFPGSQREHDLYCHVNINISEIRRIIAAFALSCRLGKTKINGDLWPRVISSTENDIIYDYIAEAIVKQYTEAREK